MKEDKKISRQNPTQNLRPVKRTLKIPNENFNYRPNPAQNFISTETTFKKNFSENKNYRVDPGQNFKSLEKTLKNSQEMSNYRQNPGQNFKSTERTLKNSKEISNYRQNPVQKFEYPERTLKNLKETCNYRVIPAQNFKMINSTLNNSSVGMKPNDNKTSFRNTMEAELKEIREKIDELWSRKLEMNKRSNIMKLQKDGIKNKENKETWSLKRNDCVALNDVRSRREAELQEIREKIDELWSRKLDMIKRSNKMSLQKDGIKNKENMETLSLRRDDYVEPNDVGSRREVIDFSGVEEELCVNVDLDEVVKAKKSSLSVDNDDMRVENDLMNGTLNDRDREKKSEVIDLCVINRDSVRVCEEEILTRCGSLERFDEIRNGNELDSKCEKVLGSSFKSGEPLSIKEIKRHGYSMIEEDLIKDDFKLKPLDKCLKNSVLFENYEFLKGEEVFQVQIEENILVLFENYESLKSEEVFIVQNEENIPVLFENFEFLKGEGVFNVQDEENIPEHIQVTLQVDNLIDFKEAVRVEVIETLDPVLSESKIYSEINVKVVNYVLKKESNVDKAEKVLKLNDEPKDVDLKCWIKYVQILFLWMVTTNFNTKGRLKRYHVTLILYIKTVFGMVIRINCGNKIGPGGMLISALLINIVLSIKFQKKGVNISKYGKLEITKF